MPAQDNQLKQERTSEIREAWSAVSFALCGIAAGGVVMGIGIGRAMYTIAPQAAVILPSIIGGAVAITAGVMMVRRAFVYFKTHPHP